MYDQNTDSFCRNDNGFLNRIRYLSSLLLIQLLNRNSVLTGFVSRLVPAGLLLNYLASHFSILCASRLLNRYIDHNERITKSLEALNTIYSFRNKNKKVFDKLTKTSIDSLWLQLNNKGTQGILHVLDQIGSVYGFHKFDPLLRYFFIRLIQSSSAKVLSQLTCFDQQTIEAVIPEYAASQPTFSSIAKHLILPVLETDKYLRLNRTPIQGMPKILLIGSYFGYEMRGGLFVAPQLGIHRLASFLSLFGIRADILDPRLVSVEEIMENVRQNQYEVIGFNILYPPFDSLKLIHEIHSVSPSSVLIAGGQGAAFNYSLILNHTPLFAVVSAYGEFPVLDFIANNCKVNNIRGVYYKTQSGTIEYTGPITAFTQNDLRVVSLALDFSQIPYDLYWSKVSGVYSAEHLKIMKAQESVRTIRLYTETHCPMKCDFCSSTNFLDNAIQGVHKVRFLNASDILLLIRRALKMHPGTQAFYFNDDEFLLNKKRIKDLCMILKTQSIYKGLKFICMARVDNISEEILSDLKEAGFSIISYGIESFSDKVLKDMDKKLNSKHTKDMGQIAIDAVELTLKAGLTPRINFILFYPTISREDLQITVDCATSLILKGAPPTYYTFVELFPGSSIMEKDYKQGWVYETEELPDGSKIEIPTKVLPLDPEIREVCLKALEIHPQSVSELKATQLPNLEGNLPTSIDTLVLFKNLYELLQIPSEHIEEAILAMVRQVRKEGQNKKLISKDLNEPIFII